MNGVAGIDRWASRHRQVSGSQAAAILQRSEQRIDSNVITELTQAASIGSAFLGSRVSARAAGFKPKSAPVMSLVQLSPLCADS
jgi:hypothetical protein